MGRFKSPFFFFSLLDREVSTHRNWGINWWNWWYPTSMSCACVCNYMYNTYICYICVYCIYIYIYTHICILVITYPYGIQYIPCISCFTLIWISRPLEASTMSSSRCCNSSARWSLERRNWTRKKKNEVQVLTNETSMFSRNKITKIVPTRWVPSVFQLRFIGITRWCLFEALLTSQNIQWFPAAIFAGT